MKAMGTEIGTIHFVGIGGIGMSGIAEVMHQLGYKVQGSDQAEGYVVEGLRKLGIPVMIGHSADNLGQAAVVVCSSAIKDGNPEVYVLTLATGIVGLPWDILGSTFITLGTGVPYNIDDQSRGGGPNERECEP